MAIRFFSDPVRVLSIGRNPIQVLLIRSDPVRVLSIRSDPIRSRFCKPPSGLDVPLVCQLSYEVGQKRLRTILGGKSRRISLSDLVANLRSDVFFSFFWKEGGKYA